MSLNEIQGERVAYYSKTRQKNAELFGQIILVTTFKGMQ